MKRVNVKNNNEVNEKANEFKMANTSIQSHLKKVKYLFVVMAMAATMSLVSCSSDDDPQPQYPEKIQPTPPELPQNPTPPIINPN